MWQVAGAVVLLAALLASPLILICIILLAYRLLGSLKPNRKLGFFHPYAASGGGGERVLFCALQTLPATCTAVIYIGEPISSEKLLQDAQHRFNFAASDVKCKIIVVELQYRTLLEAKHYPRFTLLGQSLGSMLLGLEAFLRHPVGVWIDTTGCAFTYPLAWLGGAKVVTYTHYPTISMDMLEVVARRDVAFNNDADVANSYTKSTAKLFYYRFFAMLYGFVGRFAAVVMVNSGWTLNHIRQLWRGTAPVVVYPPCGTTSFQKFALSDRRPWALSVAQFRPEKNHSLQLQSMKVLLDTYPVEMQSKFKDFKIILLGSCRGADDEARVRLLREECEALGLTDRIEFVVNAPFAELTNLLSKASIGLHTMRNEHFGIGIVEMMAAGLVVIAHNSGGPREDIVKDGTGYLATTPEEYASHIFDILTQSSKTQELRGEARRSAGRFSDEIFKEHFQAALSPMLDR
ncbi:asparagine-linked glycosylation protein [Aphanomyces cochlioides]|nr:asparagine-linked glycosylation protein [Aphanomyces cochlioides]